MGKKSRRKTEFGDFQTPYALALQACALLSSRGFAPATVVEPTCGVGNFLRAAVETFPTAQNFLGLEINPGYVEQARANLATYSPTASLDIIEKDFYEYDWRTFLKRSREPILVIGNPPWVTNSELGLLGSTNLPVKSNVYGLSGFDAVSGKSNFDISEWMLLVLMQLLSGRNACLGMLCKTSVARKVLLYAWKNRLTIQEAAIHPINAKEQFGAAVDACFLTCHFTDEAVQTEASVYSDLDSRSPVQQIGLREGELVADVVAFDRWKHLRGAGPYKWRSGIKHDCSKIMEFEYDGTTWLNGLGEQVTLEPDCLYPMLKSSDIANGSVATPRKWMLVTQQYVGQDTRPISAAAPLTWQYLLKHSEFLDRRGSSIYKKRARFSIFGVGDYSFADWKVAISGLYKRLTFRVVGPHRGKPVVLDDTAYSIPCATEDEAECVCSLLSSDVAKEFLGAYVFWDSKRPITVQLLSRLDVSALAKQLGRSDELSQKSGTSVVAARSRSLF